ncbi:RNA 2',3'-cyclic phosphodiesterase [Streptacidiphilus fuscans]|uniref:RNA 2',3'-cyclic phosphodiesterase n=1 Tax=Streptacidiphilus fuscans TaxID=2789292 RepID=A0A931B3M7_9ACTN|nr:RNA 2',3'-cyclic phosphodiesterase [Streptacidiphilus fuscans]MBF9068052.1 RNA 2',3'-cyclic phosphodiesterase [Streptacidiphilus fuscans]
MRLFLAVVPPDSVLQELDAAVRPLRRLPQGAGLRWTALETWHLTLAFLGHVDTEQLAALEPRLAHVAHEHPAHTLRITGGGRFGDRALWAGVGGETKVLHRVAEEVGDAARRSGIAVDDRPFRGHLTLARSGSARADLRPFARELEEYEGTQWTAGSIHLIRSYLGAGPVRYETLQEWTLTADSSVG